MIGSGNASASKSTVTNGALRLDSSAQGRLIRGPSYGAHVVRTLIHREGLAISAQRAEMEVSNGNAAAWLQRQPNPFHPSSRMRANGSTPAKRIGLASKPGQRQTSSDGAPFGACLSRSCARRPASARQTNQLLNVDEPEKKAAQRSADKC